jgi:phage terminase small subunit
MPRTSSEALVTLRTAIPTPALQPPEYLTPEQQQDWHTITSQLPAEHFASDNAHLLAQLCQHISYSRQLAEQLELLRHTPLTRTTLKAVKDRAAFVELLAMHRDQTKAIVSLSLKLRLCPSAYRRDGRTNERLARVSPSGPKPWLDWGRDRDDAASIESC